MYINLFGGLDGKNKRKLLILNSQFRVILERKLISELKFGGETERTKFKFLTNPPVTFN
jgi:hypothetical protein